VLVIRSEFEQLRVAYGLGQAVAIRSVSQTALFMFVATLAGTAFGAMGKGFLRLSYANSMENLMEATRRIGQFVESLAAVPAD